MESQQPHQPPGLTVAQAKANLRLAADDCDLGKIIRRNPLTSLAVAGVLGLAVARLDTSRLLALKALFSAI